MPLNADYLLAKRFVPFETILTERDAMFYALSIGVGRDPMDAHELRYVYEKDLRTFPTMPIVIGHAAAWMGDPATGITLGKVVHGAQRLSIFQPLPTGRPIVSTERVEAIWDRGDKGAILEVVRDASDKLSDTLLATSRSSIHCRADGGFGGPVGASYTFLPVPDRAPDRSIAQPTAPNMALLYRLNEDRNPLHADPSVAAEAGFARPILHGLASYGIAAAAIAKTFPERPLNGLETRFTNPVFPGETILIDMWDEADGIAFRARVAERGAIVLDSGRATFA